jgi:hypothetical protein
MSLKIPIDKRRFVTFRPDWCEEFRTQPLNYTIYPLKSVTEWPPSCRELFDGMQHKPFFQKRFTHTITISWYDERAFFFFKTDNCFLIQAPDNRAWDAIVLGKNPTGEKVEVSSYCFFSCENWVKTERKIRGLRILTSIDGRFIDVDSDGSPAKNLFSQAYGETELGKPGVATNIVGNPFEGIIKEYFNLEVNLPPAIFNLPI